MARLGLVTPLSGVHGVNNGGGLWPTVICRTRDVGEWVVALLQPVIDRADSAGLPCYLQTAQPDNVAFYEHLGFTRLVGAVEPRSGLRL